MSSQRPHDKCCWKCGVDGCPNWDCTDPAHDASSLADPVRRVCGECAWDERVFGVVAS